MIDTAAEPGGRTMRAALGRAYESRSTEESAPRRRAPVMLGEEDLALLQRLRSGAPDAVEALFDRYHAKVFGLAMSILGNESDAEEVVQDVFLAVARKVDLFRGDSALYSWIYRICVNACWMRLRKGRRSKTTPIEPFLPAFTKDGAHVGPVDDWTREVEKRYLQKELGEVIGKYARTLPEKYRVVFALCDVQELSYKETADVLDLSVAAVKSRLHRARLYLRESLTRYLRDGRVAHG